MLSDILTDEDNSIPINRDQFNELCKELFERLICITRNSLSEVKMKASDIDKVLLIGGSSRIPKLEELLGDIFGKEKLDCSMNPDEAVAYGAAVRAAQICSTTTFVSPNITLVEATPLSLGTAITHGRFGIVIPRNTSIPCRKTVSRTTAHNNQKSFGFTIYEGERPLVENNNQLGHFALYNLTPGIAESAKGLLTFELNKDGILKVSATHNDEKSELLINYVQSKSPQKCIEDLLQEAKLFKEHDDKVYEAMGAKSHLQGSVEKAKYRISNETLTEGQKNKLQRAIDDAESCLKNSTSKDKNVFEEKKKEFDEICNNN